MDVRSEHREVLRELLAVPEPVPLAEERIAGALGADVGEVHLRLHRLWNAGAVRLVRHRDVICYERRGPVPL